jgi:hypothetical protein
MDSQQGSGLAYQRAAAAAPGQRRSGRNGPTGLAPAPAPPGAADAAPAAVAADLQDDSYLHVSPGNTTGRTSVLTVLSPLPRRWSGPLRLVLWLKRRRGPDPTMQAMSFIHYAHWVVITRFPDQRRRTRYAYLLFQSNFNGTWGSYLDAFSVVIPKKMALIWGTSFGFPGALPPRPFRRYIQTNDLSLDHYYAAYPEASATEVASALRVSDLFDRLVRPAVDRDPATFAAAWQQFVQNAQRDL